MRQSVASNSRCSCCKYKNVLFFRDQKCRRKHFVFVPWVTTHANWEGGGRGSLRKTSPVKKKFRHFGSSLVVFIEIIIIPKLLWGVLLDKNVSDGDFVLKRRSYIWSGDINFRFKRTATGIAAGSSSCSQRCSKASSPWMRFLFSL